MVDRNRVSGIGIAILASIGVWFATSSPVLAQDKSGFPGSFSANVSFTSEYYFRGLS